MEACVGAHHLSRKLQRRTGLSEHSPAPRPRQG
jgi:hypothetical protein